MKDPPPEFLRRFDNLKLNLRPVSDARLPKRGEMETPGRHRGVEDPDSGKRTSVHFAMIKEWVSDTKVKVETGVWRGPLSGGGSTVIYELRNGKWKETGRENSWIS